MALDTPAIIVGSGINGLGVARSLAAARVRVCMLDDDARRPEMRTRAAKPLVVPSLHSETLIDELVRLGTTRFAGMRPVLLLTQEESVKLVSHQRERLAPLYRFSLPPVAVVDALQHKYGFQQLAEKFGAPIPKLVHVHTLADLPALTTLHYPVAVKPGERSDSYSQQFKKAYRVEDATAAAELVRHMLTAMPDIVVQEWIEGPDANIHFCLQAIARDGQVAASFTGRKIRAWPPHVGGTASCMPAPDAHIELNELTTRFFRATGVIGLASMEYKRDATSGQFRMVEPTIGRTDYQEEVATLNGVNLPFAACCAELGLSFPKRATPARRIAWRVHSEDLQSAAAQQQDPASGFDGTDTIADALWRGSDPMPWLVQNFRRVRDALSTRLAKLHTSAPTPRNPA